MKKKSCRAAIYIRSSVEHYLPAQEVLLREHARRSGYTVSGVYEDYDPGLRRTVRTGLDALLADASNGKADRVLVMDASRLGRSVYAMKETTEALETNGVVVEIVGGAVRDAASALVAEFQRLMTADEPRRHGQRTAAGIAAARRRREQKGKGQ